jgi:hypothetical protein
VIETVDGDRFFATFHLTDELAAEAGPVAQSLLTQTPLLAERPQTLAEELSYVLDGSISHGTFPSRDYEFRAAHRRSGLQRNTQGKCHKPL